MFDYVRVSIIKCSQFISQLKIKNQPVPNKIYVVTKRRKKNNQNIIADKKSNEEHSIENIKIYLRTVYKITSVTSQKNK